MEALGHSWPFSTSSPFPLNHQRLAEANRCSVLGLIWRKRCLSQKDLTARTHLRASTVSNIIRELKGGGLIEDGVAIEAERVGPKETELEIVPGYGWSVGLALDEEFRMVIIDGAGRVLAHTDFPRGYTDAQLVRELPAELERVRKMHSMDWRRFAGIGISVAGVVDSDNGIVLLSRNLRERSEPLKAKMEAALKTPVFVERNVVCGAYAEHFAGAARDVESFLYFSVTKHHQSRPGFGLAIVIDERIFRGSNSAAGEIDFLVDSLLPVNKTVPTDETFYSKCGEALAAIINLLDIHCVVLADADLNGMHLKTLEAKMSSQLVSVPGREINLRQSALRSNSHAYGAALMKLHQNMARDLIQSKHEANHANGHRKLAAVA
ncbi:MAG TPA: ROK family transcriptional regulator [Chthoniobacteraceae bacterium]|jgi:hypothetical protein|nr:ROK family transcriptional regulator [Chthoniobacteraceae bacterium]